MVVPKSSNTIEVNLPSRIGYEKIAMNAAASVAKLMGFDEGRIEDLKTAVAEACINAIEHGNKLDESRTVGVVLSTDDGSLEVKVLDTGAGTPSSVHTPDIDKKMHGEEASRGMGMFLIQELMDEAEWVSSPHSGSYVRMVIRMGKGKK